MRTPETTGEGCATQKAARPATGVFFHDVFRGRQWDIIGDKFRRFPEVLGDALTLPQVKFFASPPVSEDLLLKIHTPRFVDDLKRAWYYDGVRHSVGGCVEAVERVMSGELVNALVFNVAAGHHAERDYSWGGTYASCAGPAFWNARQKFGPHRFAILDTDAHHGNGTRDVFRDDPEVLHVCFCNSYSVECDGLKVCIDTGWQSSDREYLDKVRNGFIPRAKNFRPDLILHNLGHDTCEGDYGDLGLTPEFFIELAREVNRFAQEVCQGRYAIVTHGGCRADVAEYIFPAILRILAGSR
ncbi:MAG: histone deacetylase [Dehalococcoidia bacterium]|nr:histone deacetylase [Dehalococcoidia bacterium]